MAIYLENIEARYLTNLYFECRKQNKYPAPGSWGQQTAFAAELFEFLDDIVAESEYKNRKIQSPKK